MTIVVNASPPQQLARATLWRTGDRAIALDCDRSVAGAANGQTTDAPVFMARQVVACARAVP